MAGPTDDLESLRRSEQRFRAAFALQFHFLAILDADGRVLEFNRQLGWDGPELSRTQIVGLPFWDTPWWRDDPAMRAAWPQRLRAAAGASVAVLYDDAYTSSTGERRHASAAISAVRLADGTLDSFIVQATDTTERRRADALKLALQDQWQESQKLEAIGTLAGGIAHDFNNILGAILGNVALAQEAAGAAHPVLAPLGQIRLAGQRARTLVQQILAFSRREPHELVARPLRPVVDETLALLRATLPGTVQLDTRLDDVPLWARADATQIQQVLMNLCTNAWHALPEGRGRIEVGLAPLPPNDVGLWVADDGVGMDEATRARIFEPFFTTKGVHEGTGLGLAVAHGIVVAHGGRIEVDSRPGAGSRFTLVLPRIDPGAETAERSELPAIPRDGGGRRVLYVDDDEFMALVVEGLMRTAGYHVTVLRDGQQALALLRERPLAFDLVVTDYNMPRCSGLELAREVARLRPALPVIISSGYVSETLRTEARAAGVRHVMHKENTLEELHGLARRCLGDI